MRVIQALLLLACASATATADDSVPGEEFAAVAARLAAPAVLRGNFQQTRQLRVIARPLVSSGYFLLSDLGLYWRQDYPVESVMIADGERLLQSVGGGPLQAIDVGRNPVALTFSQSFLSIFEGKEDDLRRNFEVSFTPAAGPDSSWTIELVPTTYPVSEAIVSITLRGREHIDDLRVVSRAGDETVIRFSDLRTEPTELGENEIELYAR